MSENDRGQSQLIRQWLRLDQSRVPGRTEGRGSGTIESGIEERIARIRKLGLLVPALLDDGPSLLCRSLFELGRVDSGAALVVFSHWAAVDALAFASAPFPELGGFAPFQTPRESLRLRAEPRGGRWVLEGSAPLVVLASGASGAVVLAQTPDQAQYFWIEDLPRSTPARTLGTRGCPLMDLELKQTEATFLGNPPMHERMALQAAAIVLGIAQSSLDEAAQYARVRYQGGRPIAQWSEIKTILGRMHGTLRTATLAFDALCVAADADRTGWRRDAASFAVFAQELACETTSDGIQVLGGAGYTTEFAQEERFRSAHQLQHLLGSISARKLRVAESWDRET